jgi:hypothetical protein
LGNVENQDLFTDMAYGKRTRKFGNKLVRLQRLSLHVYGSN